MKLDLPKTDLARANPLTLAAQLTFAELDLYPRDKIDGQDGPMTRTAARKFMAAVAEANDAQPPKMATTPYEWLRRYDGLKEWHGPKHNPVILKWFTMVGATWYTTDETPWCGAAVGAAAIATGHETPSPRWKSVTAKEWLNVGEKIWTAGEPSKGLLRVKEGDVLIRERAGGGHVAFTPANIIPSDTRDNYYGGNQRNMVRLDSYDRAGLIGVRRLRKI